MTEFICIRDRLINVEHIVSVSAWRLSAIGENDQYHPYPDLYPGYSIYSNLTKFVLARLTDKEKQEIGWYMAADDVFVRTDTWEKARMCCDEAAEGKRRLNSGVGRVPGYFEVGAGPVHMQHTKWINGEPVEDSRWHLPLDQYRKIIAYQVDLNCPCGGINYSHESYFVMAWDFQNSLQVLRKYMSVDWPKEE